MDSENKNEPQGCFDWIITLFQLGAVAFLMYNFVKLIFLMIQL